MEKEPVDLLCISEKWLKEGDDPTEYNIEGYDIQCQNREIFTGNGTVKRG